MGLCPSHHFKTVTGIFFFVDPTQVPTPSRYIPYDDKVIAETKPLILVDTIFFFLLYLPIE